MLEVMNVCNSHTIQQCICIKLSTSKKGYQYILK